MGRYRIYATTTGVYLKPLSYGENDAGDVPKAVASDLEGLGVGGVEQENISKALDDGEKSGLLLTEDTPDDFPGVCWVDVDDEEGAAMLTITSPLGNGCCVEESDIMDQLQAAGAGDFTILHDAIKQALGKAQKLDEPYSCKVAERSDAQVQLDISPDKLEVRLATKDAHGGAELKIDDILKALEEKGVTFGILKEDIEQIVADKSEVTDALVAKGKESINGEDGRIEYHFDAFAEDVGPKILENDIADFKDLGLFESVAAGDLLATRIPPTEGEEGTDVFGNPIPAVTGKDTTLPVGKNTEEGKDPNTLVATAEGQPKLVGGKVIVDELLDIRGDVDLSTGNIDFVGSVIIRGAIYAGFEVKAGDSVTCLDVVEGAEIEAGGDVVLKWGMKGQNRGVIKAGGDVMAKFIESSKVIAGGSVIVEDFIMNSDVRATKEIKCSGKKGWISGGHLSAGEEVNCKVIGNETGVKTEVEVGIQPQLRVDYHSLKMRLNEIAPKIEMMSKTYSQLEELKKKGLLSDEKEEMRYKIMNALSQLEREFEQGEKQIAEIEKILNNSHGGRIVASEIVYSGIILTIGSLKECLYEPWKKVTFTSDGNEIQMSSL